MSIKAPKTIHEAQEPHSKEDCKINESPHNHPDVDCGHSVDGPGPGTYGTYVPSGPGAAVPEGPGWDYESNKPK